MFRMNVHSECHDNITDSDNGVLNMPKNATFRFYEELNDFLPDSKRKISFDYEFDGAPSIKDSIEAIGVPHTEVDLVIANGVSETFLYHLRGGDFISVYPVFESLDISDLAHLRDAPLRQPKFIADVHLGKLAKYMRLLGFDTLYRNDYDDPEIIDISVKEKRAILTRDIGILKNGIVTHGYWVRSKIPLEQLKEILLRFDLVTAINPFSRCMECNGFVSAVDKKNIEHRLEPNTKQHYNEFHTCDSCGNIYWKGSHYEKMIDFVEKIKAGYSDYS
jgi:uncharacterized protein